MPRDDDEDDDFADDDDEDDDFADDDDEDDDFADDDDEDDDFADEEDEEDVAFEDVDEEDPYDENRDDLDNSDYEDKVGDEEEAEADEEEEAEAIIEELGEHVDTSDMCREEKLEIADQLLSEEEELLSEEEYERFVQLHGSPQPPQLRAASPYENICWGPHHAKISSGTHQRCRAKCGWLICRCGNCWCNMPPELQAKYPVRCEYIDGAKGPCPICKARPTSIKDGVVTRCTHCDGRGYFGGDSRRDHN